MQPVDELTAIMTAVKAGHYQETCNLLARLLAGRTNSMFYQEPQDGCHIRTAICLCRLLSVTGRYEAILATVCELLFRFHGSMHAAGSVTELLAVYATGNRDKMIASQARQEWGGRMTQIGPLLFMHLTERVEHDATGQTRDQPAVASSDTTLDAMRERRRCAAIAEIDKKAEELVSRGLTSVSLDNLFVDASIRDHFATQLEFVDREIRLRGDTL